MYSDLDVGGEVKIFRKRKPNDKGRVGNYSQHIYIVEDIENKLGQQYYTFEGNDRQYLQFQPLNTSQYNVMPVAMLNP